MVCHFEICTSPLPLRPDQITVARKPVKLSRSSYWEKNYKNISEVCFNLEKCVKFHEIEHASTA